MFPDATSSWKAHKSIIDETLAGLEVHPYVFDCGFWLGSLHLVLSTVRSRPGHVTATPGPCFRIEIGCQIYFGVEEAIYMTAQHMGQAGTGTYLSEATSSAPLSAWPKIDVLNGPVRHFKIGSYDMCFETLGFHEPVVTACATEAEAFDWKGPLRRG